MSIVISTEATGIYKVLKQMGGIVSQLANPVYQAIYPDFSKEIAANNYQESFSYAFKIGGILLAVTLPVAVLAGSTSFIWFPKFFGESFSTGVPALIVYLLIKAISMGLIAIHPLFIANGFVKSNAFINLSCNLIYIGIVYILGLYFGLVGIVFAFLIQFGMKVTTKIFILRREIRKKQIATYI